MLREEILNSISLQYKTFVSEGLILSTVLALGFIQDPFRILLLAVPPLFISLTALWLIEQSRMMRAGNFLSILEDEINLEINEIGLFWENWLRLRKVSFFSPHRIHHFAQYLLVIMTYFIVTLLSIAGCWIYQVLPSDILTWITIIYGFMLFLLFIPVWKIIIHKRAVHSREEFLEWKDKYLAYLKMTYIPAEKG